VSVLRSWATSFVGMLQKGLEGKIGKGFLVEGISLYPPT